MTTLIVIIAIIAILLVIYTIKFDKDFSVSASEEFAVEPEKAFDAVTDFVSWKDWSPWLMHDPDNVQLTYSESPAPNEVNGFYSWKSDKLGEGTLTHKEFKKPSFINQELKFVKPWKSVAQTTWTFEKVGEKTKVTWSMSSSLPFHFRWLKPLMMRAIPNDYHTGLLMLHQILNPDATKWKMKFNEIVEQPKFECIGNMYSGPINQAMKDQLAKDFSTYKQFKQDGKPHTYINACTKMKMFKDFIELKYGIAPAPEGEAKEGYIKFEVPGGKFMKSTYWGGYEHIGLAWHQAGSNMRMNKAKFDKSRYPYEVNIFGPDQSENQDEYVTEIYFPIK